MKIRAARSLYKRIGANIRRLRLARGFTQEELAEELGMTRTSLVNLEAGRQRILLHRALELAQVFKITMDDLIT